MILVYMYLSRVRSIHPWRQEYILKLNAVVAYTGMVYHTCISFNANFCSFSMVRSFAMSSNCVWLQIIFCSCINETRFFSFLRSLLHESAVLRFPKIFIKNKLGNQMIKQFLNSVIAKYYDLSASKLKTEANNWSAQPHPLFVNNQKVRKEILSSQYDSSIVFCRKNR